LPDLGILLDVCPGLPSVIQAGVAGRYLEQQAIATQA